MFRCHEGFLFPPRIDSVKATKVTARARNNVYVLTDRRVVEVREAGEFVIKFSELLVNNFYRVSGIDSGQVDDYKFVRYIFIDKCQIH